MQDLDYQAGEVVEIENEWMVLRKTEMGNGTHLYIPQHDECSLCVEAKFGTRGGLET